MKKAEGRIDRERLDMGIWVYSISRERDCHRERYVDSGIDSDRDRQIDAE